MDINKTICAAATSPIIQDISKYTKELVNYNNSPIDNFYNTRDEILSSVNPQISNAHPIILPLISIGFISATENYFRDLLAGIIRICPISKKNAAEKNINLASLWQGGYVEKGVFENSSFADAKKIKNTIKDIIGFDARDGTQTSERLNQYGTLCQLRHAIIHSDSILAGKNSVKLQLPITNNQKKVTIKYGEFQEIAHICTALIRSVNIDLFSYLSEQWCVKWPQLPTFNHNKHNNNFKKIWILFYSNIDKQNNLIIDNYSMVKVRNQIKKKYI